MTIATTAEYCADNWNLSAVQVVESSSAEEGSGRCAPPRPTVHCFDIVIVDDQMPGCDGVTLRHACPGQHGVR